MTSPVSLVRVASTVAPSDYNESCPASIDKEVNVKESFTYEILFDIKPMSDQVRQDERLLSIVTQARQIGQDAFWGNDCFLECSKRHGWRLNIIAETPKIGDEVFGFVVYKIDSHDMVLHIQYIAVAEKYRRRGVGSKLIKSLQQYAAKTLTVSTVTRIVCACVPEAVPFYQKHCFRKAKRIVATEEEQQVDHQIPLQFQMEWKVPDKRKNKSHTRKPL
jgi:ribosomal protein S18 acetylase RimI-like enzyme